MVLVHGDVDGHVDEGFDRGVVEDFTIDDGFDLFELFVGHLGEVREVEAQAVGLDRGSGLLDVRAEDLTQRGVEQVRAGVIAPDGVAALAIDDGVDVVADGERLLEHGFVRAHALHRRTQPVISATVVLPSAKRNQPVSPIWPPESA